MSGALVTCPTCEGRREYGVYACPGFRLVMVSCKRCKASGLVSIEEADRITEGKRRAAGRKARGLSLRQEADRLGMTPMQLADIEFAR